MTKPTRAPATTTLNQALLLNALAGFFTLSTLCVCLYFGLILINPNFPLNPFPPATAIPPVPTIAPPSTVTAPPTALATLPILPIAWTATPGGGQQALLPDVTASETPTPGIVVGTPIPPAPTLAPSPTDALILPPTNTALPANYPGPTGTNTTVAPTATPQSYP